MKWYKDTVLKLARKPLPQSLTSMKISGFLMERCGRSFPKSVCPQVRKATAIFLTLSLFDRTHEWKEIMSMSTLRKKYSILENIRKKIVYHYAVEGWRPSSYTDVVSKVFENPEPLKGREHEVYKKLIYCAASLKQPLMTSLNTIVYFVSPQDIGESLGVDYNVSLMLIEEMSMLLRSNEVLVFPYYTEVQGKYELRVGILTKLLLTDSKSIIKCNIDMLQTIASAFPKKHQEVLRSPDGFSLAIKKTAKWSEVEEWLGGEFLISVIEQRF